MLEAMLFMTNITVFCVLFYLIFRRFVKVNGVKHGQASKEEIYTAAYKKAYQDGYKDAVNDLEVHPN